MIELLQLEMELKQIDLLIEKKEEKREKILFRIDELKMELEKEAVVV